jgi:PAS domain S-box-containing protein
MDRGPAPQAPIDISDPATLTMDGQGRIVEWSDAAEALFGWSRDEVLGQRVADTIIPPFYREAHQRGLDAYKASGQPVVVGRFVEVTALRRDGSEFPVELFVTAHTGAERDLRFTAVLRDLGRREASRRYRSMELEVSRSLIQVTEVSQALDQALAAVARGAGCDLAQLWLRDASSGALILRHSWESGPTNVAQLPARNAAPPPPPWDVMARVWRSGLTFMADTTVPDSHDFLTQAVEAGLRSAIALPLGRTEPYPGALVLWSAHTRPVDDDLLAAMGSIAGQIGLALARHHAETTLQDRERRFRALLESAPDAMVVVSADGIIRSVNRQAELLFGYRREEIVGQSVELLVPARVAELHPRHRASYVADPRTRPMGAGRNLAARRKDATEVPCDIALSSLESDEGLLAVVAVRDASERMAVQDDLARSNRELEQFAYVASHDLSEPLRVVAGFAELLSEELGDRLSDAGVEYLGFIKHGVRRMKTLIDDLLAYSRAGSHVGPFAMVDCNDVMNIVLDALARRIEEGDVQVTVERLPTLPGQATELVQLFQNLVSNALKFRAANRAAKVVIAARRQADMWHFTVTDNGIGIPPAQRQVIFGMFKRLHGRGEYEGTGIGLAICEKVARRHGGEMWVDDAPGGGSCFHVTLPATNPLPEQAGQRDDRWNAVP